jgi:predicted nucleic acid-binding protein
MVLTRAKFNFNKDEIKRLINLFMESGLPVIPKTSVIPMLDESDRVFYDVAQTSRACLITGNLKHYPQGPFIMSPAAFLEIADGRITGATP